LEGGDEKFNIFIGETERKIPLAIHGEGENNIKIVLKIMDRRKWIGFISLSTVGSLEQCNRP
jgi:hypothetical protein